MNQRLAQEDLPAVSSDLIEDPRSHLASIIESSDDAIVSKTLEGVIKSWNRGAERIFGYTAGEVIGQPILILIPEDRRYEETEILSRIVQGDRIDHFETVRQRKDGSFVQVSVTVSPVRNAAGQIVGASKVARDITDQKVAAETIRSEMERLVGERTAQLERANKELEGFTYSVSHDLRGPLRSIVASCMILREDFGPNLPTEAQAELDKQSRAAKKMADLIDDLLKLSRLGRQELKKTTLDITAIAKDLANDVHPGERTCEFDIQPGMTAYGDSPTIRLAIGNLIENACKFSDKGERIQIGFENGAFFVKDHGIGFDQQYAEKIFMPFERLVLERDYPGTGIGLANVKRIIDRHDGKVWAESAGQGKGATFYFSLPGK
jgi:PAS domain S-box-containing protein